jgi:hypothetical protein
LFTISEERRSEYPSPETDKGEQCLFLWKRSWRASNSGDGE